MACLMRALARLRNGLKISKCRSCVRAALALISLSLAACATHHESPPIQAPGPAVIASCPLSTFSFAKRSQGGQGIVHGEEASRAPDRERRDSTIPTD